MITRNSQEHTTISEPKIIPQDLIDHLKKREGWRINVYLDSLGKPTAGLGHLLSAKERSLYPVGTRVPDEVLNRWAEKDTAKAYNAALKQSETLRLESREFVVALASVNFQLGTGWYTIHKQTWAFLLDHDWERAALEAERSAWFKQTPVRVRDFQKAVRALRESEEYIIPLDRLTGTGIVIATRLNVRTGPGTQYPPTGSALRKGDSVAIFGTAADWHCIGEKRWVSAHYITVSEA